MIFAPFAYRQEIIGVTPTPTPSPSPTPTPTPTPTPAPGLVTSGMTIYIDMLDPASYPGTGTTLFDLTANNYDATLYNGPVYTSGPPAYFTYDGVNDYAQLPNASKGSDTDNWTVLGWVKQANFSTFLLHSARGRDGAGSGWSLSTGINTSAKVEANVVTTSPSTIQLTSAGTTTCSADTWYYIGTVWTNGVSLKSYLNGVNESTLTTTRTNLRSSTEGFYMGRINNLYFKPSIASLHVYNRTLSDAEILQNFNAQKANYGY